MWLVAYFLYDDTSGEKMAIWHFGEDEDNVLDMRRSASTHNLGKKPDKVIGNFNILTSCPWDKFLLSKFLESIKPTQTN